MILPSITHDVAVWVGLHVCNTKESESSLKSVQYAMAKATMQTKSSPAMTATLGELVWLPLNYCFGTHAGGLNLRLGHVLSSGHVFISG